MFAGQADENKSCLYGKAVGCFTEGRGKNQKNPKKVVKISDVS
jgi:hypothetical protein